MDAAVVPMTRNGIAAASYGAISNWLAKGGVGVVGDRPWVSWLLCGMWSCYGSRGQVVCLWAFAASLQCCGSCQVLMSDLAVFLFRVGW